MCVMCAFARACVRVATGARSSSEAHGLASRFVGAGRFKWNMITEYVVAEYVAIKGSVTPSAN